MRRPNMLSEFSRVLRDLHPAAFLDRASGDPVSNLGSIRAASAEVLQTKKNGKQNSNNNNLQEEQ